MGIRVRGNLVGNGCEEDERLTVIACPCLNGIVGVNSRVGLQVCPKAMTRSKPSSWRLGDSNSNMVSIPFSQISCPALVSSSSLFSSLCPKPVSTSLGPNLTSKSHTALSPTEAILINSAKPFRTCPTGRVFRNEKSRKVCRGAWYAPSLDVSWARAGQEKRHDLPVLELLVVDSDCQSAPS